MRRPVRTFAMLGIAMVLGSGAAASDAQTSETESSIDLPVSFDKIWFRPGPDSGLGGGKQSGLLTISEDGLEFLAKKQSHLLPWSRVEMISYGRMSGDTDTKWVVLSLNPVAGQWSFIGYRDGRKFGYGGDTTRVFDAIVEGLRMSGSGPFAVPQGHSAYVTPFLQFSVALPEGWQHYSVSQTYLDGLPTSGRTIFSPLDLEQDHAAIHSGSEPAVFLDRFEAGESFSCRRLGKAGRRKLNEGINAAFRPMQLVSELVWTAHPHRYCTAWMSTGRAKRGDTEIDVTFYAASDDLTAYVFTIRSPIGTEIDERFESISRSLKTAVAH